MEKSNYNENKMGVMPINKSDEEDDIVFNLFDFTRSRR